MNADNLSAIFGMSLQLIVEDGRYSPQTVPATPQRIGSEHGLVP